MQTTTPKLCPRDRTPLTPTRFLNLIMDSCPACDGTWLNKGELGQILGGHHDLEPGQGLVDDDPRGRAECPDCGAEMIARWFSPDRKILVDRCPSCWGIWLDAQELQNILRESYRKNQDHLVFATAGGSRYHRSGCRHAGSRARSLSREEAAAQKLQPCRSCRPDQG